MHRKYKAKIMLSVLILPMFQSYLVSDLIETTNSLGQYLYFSACLCHNCGSFLQQLGFLYTSHHIAYIHEGSTAL